jgi:hypothetical protein
LTTQRKGVTYIPAHGNQKKQFSAEQPTQILKMSDLQSLITHILRFRDDREWKQFHNAKNLAQFLLL